MCCIVYFISYITRKNYAAIMVEFVNDTGIAIDSASLALTGHAIFYGAGQLVSGYLGDKIKPKFLITCGLFTTALMNILLPLCSEVALLTTVWCINGLAQAMMWPPIVKALSSTFSSSDDYKKSTVKVSNSAMIATVLLYLLSPVCITYAGWETIFYVAGALAAVMAFVVLFFMPDTADQKETAPEKTNDKEETLGSMVGHHRNRFRAGFHSTRDLRILGTVRCSLCSSRSGGRNHRIGSCRTRMCRIRSGCHG
jgi:OPA family glycerol-3-phosphate transporter-like MFS transporter